MKKEKMSLEKMKSVLSHVLSREEMKEVMAGSGGGTACGYCGELKFCYMTPYPGGGSMCRCNGDNGAPVC